MPVCMHTVKGMLPSAWSPLFDSLNLSPRPTLSPGTPSIVVWVCAGGDCLPVFGKGGEEHFWKPEWTLVLLSERMHFMQKQ